MVSRRDSGSPQRLRRGLTKSPSTSPLPRRRPSLGVMTQDVATPVEVSEDAKPRTSKESAGDEAKPRTSKEAAGEEGKARMRSNSLTTDKSPVTSPEGLRARRRSFSDAQRSPSGSPSGRRFGPPKSLDGNDASALASWNVPGAPHINTIEEALFEEAWQKQIKERVRLAHLSEIQRGDEEKRAARKAELLAFKAEEKARAEKVERDKEREEEKRRLQFRRSFQVLSPFPVHPLVKHPWLTDCCGSLALVQVASKQHAMPTSIFDGTSPSVSPAGVRRPSVHEPVGYNSSTTTWW